MARVGVWLIGAAGNVASFTVAGWAALRRRALPPIGLLTESEPLGALPLVSFDDAVFGGHEVRPRPVAETVSGLVAERVLAPEVARAVADDLGLYQAAVRPGIEVAAAGRAELDRVRADLEAFARSHDLERVVVLHLASTEPPLAAAPPEDPAELLAALGRDLRVPPSVVYAAAAIDLGFGYVNFTPSAGASLPALHRHAAATGAVCAGADGKTGETLVKTALAPMFAIRRLLVQSWFSQNVLGNNDGNALADGDRKASKISSKQAALERILGYRPQSHVGIDYLPAYGDWKVAWDQIQFQGFGGAQMSMEFTWRGSDTALAGPLCIDLVRLVEHAQRRGDRGVLLHLALFFKSPEGTDEHRLEAQYRLLLEHYAEELDPR